MRHIQSKSIRFPIRECSPTYLSENFNSGGSTSALKNIPMVNMISVAYIQVSYLYTGTSNGNLIPEFFNSVALTSILVLENFCFKLSRNFIFKVTRRFAGRINAAVYID